MEERSLSRDATDATPHRRAKTYWSSELKQKQKIKSKKELTSESNSIT